jgi:hypothetical protein
VVTEIANERTAKVMAAPAEVARRSKRCASYSSDEASKICSRCKTARCCSP